MFKRVLALVTFCACVASAQEVTAGITGSVVDPSGGTIAGATVKAKSMERGTEWVGKTNGEGIFVFPSLPIGGFTVSVEVKGFKTFQTSLTLEVNQRARVDAQMQVGSITDSVTVSTETVALQADTTQVGAVISSRTIGNMPLLSRNPVALTLLAAGVTTPSSASMNNGTRSGGGGRPYVNGNREESNNFLLDGVDNNQVSDNLTAYQPNPDAIEEFKLISNNASAEFGNFQGGIVNVVIKSGTNEIHGTVFEQFRNDKLNANNWGRNWSLAADPSTGKSPRTPLRWNQFGGTVGGPIFKDKLFFFVDYQGLRQATPTSLASTSVMPMAWRSGDFSNLLDASVTGGKVIQLYDPNQVNTTTGVRTPFTGNVIPAASLSTAATALLQNTQLYPAPTRTGLTNNIAYSTASYIKTDQGDMKFDWRPNSKDYFSSRYTNSRQDQPSVNTFPLFYNSFNIAPFQNGVISWTRTLTPTMVNELRVGVNNIMINNGGADKGLGDIATKVGIQGAGSGLLSLGAGTNGGTAFAYAAGIGNANIGTMQLFANTTYHYADNFTLIKGRHMLKMGGQVLRQDLNTFYSGNGGRTGYMNFSGRFTAANAISPAGTQIGEADFMLGLPTDIGRGLSTGTWGHRGTIYGIYGQDDWRVSNSLTLNLGLRWEYHTPWVEVKDRQANFDMITGQLMLAGQDGNSRALYNSFKKDFQPRLGFAYTPDWLAKKVVIRGGYTISSFLEGTGTNLRLPLNPPLNAEYGQLYNTSAYLMPGSTLTDGLSVLSPKDPYKGANLRLWSPDVRPAIVQQWNFTTEFALPKGNILTVGYVGQHGTHLMVAMPYKQKQLIGGVVTASPFLAGNPTLLAKISQISGTCSCANQRYDSLQTTLRKRFSSGLEYQFAYTWAHGMSDSIGYYGQGGQAGSQSAYWQNLFNQKSEWGPTYFDIQHNISASFVYQLPLGKGKKFGTNMPRALDLVAGGWQLGGIVMAHTGFPLTIKMSGDPSGTGARSFRANVTGTPHDPHKIGPGALYLDPSAYAAPTSGTFGNAGVGIVRGPGMARMDLSVGKKFPVTEKKAFELRGEAFNLTNSPVFLSPASQTITSPLFGQIRSSEGERNLQVVARFSF